MPSKILNKVILVVALGITGAFLSLYGSRPNVLYGDALGYYLYLPATFIYHNLETPDTFPADCGIDDGKMWYFHQLSENTSPTGHHLNQYTYGVALMESPFFFIAHAFEKERGLKANGYTDTYNYLIKVGTLLYALLGLVVVYRVLRKYFSETHSLLGTACIFLCTNLFWFSVYQAGMSHVILFFLYALLVSLTIRIHEKPGITVFIATGLTAGMITLIRPTDVQCLLIPLLYNVYSRETVRQKMRFLRENLSKIIVFIIAFLLPFVPQFIYWKAVTGSYIYYSYGKQSFDWLHPKIMEGLFYFFNGWFPYSPIMAFAIIGSLFYKQIKQWAWCLWIIVPVYVYVIYSWYCYNYINGLGSRPMIHLYPLLAIPLTAFIQFISKQRLFVKSVFAGILFFFLALNISYSIQELKGMLDSAESNMAYNYQILFRSSLRYKDLVTRDLAERQPDTTQLIKTCVLMCNNFNDSVSSDYVRDTATGAGYELDIRSEEFAPIDSIVYDKEKFKDASWFKCGGRFKYTQCPGYYKHKLVLRIGTKLWKLCSVENKIYDWSQYPETETIALDHCATNRWGYVYFYTKVSKNLGDGDVITMYLWNEAKSEIFMDDVCLELYKYK